MACMASESNSSVSSNKKRCSLPGPMGSLNLYTTHQQRRLSERGLMVYRPSKPDIDLIGDFINPNKKSMTTSSFPTALSSSPPKLQSSSTTTISTTVNTLPTITSPSRSPPDLAKISCHGNTNMNTSLPTRPSGTSQPPSPTQAGGYRKVRIRLQKCPGGKKNKFVEMQTIPTGTSTRSASISLERDADDMLLHHPMFDTRRFSDSATLTSAPPKISISLTADGADAGIVCSTGDLRALKCLTSSAQEIRYYSYSGSRDPSISHGESGSVSPDPHGNRSRSFDATSTVVTSRRKGIGSSWFNRRHVPISAKLPLPLKSPSVPNSPGPTQLTMKAPILTVTNEASGQSELIEVPSPPASSPMSASDDKTKVTWDQSGFQIDAAVLGSVIENHLRKTEMRRRATVSTLYEPPTSTDYWQSPSRARSASACVIPNVGLDGNLLDSKPSHPTVTFMIPGSTPRRTSLKTPGVGNCRQLVAAGRPSNTEELSGTTRKQKRFSISGPSTFGPGYTPMIPSPGVKGHGHETIRKNSTPSYVETVDQSSGKVQTTTISSYSIPYTYVAPPIKARISTEEEEEEESRRRTAYYKKVNAQGQGTGLSICSAIRDFIMHSLKS